MRRIINGEKLTAGAMLEFVIRAPETQSKKMTFRLAIIAEKNNFEKNKKKLMDMFA